MYNEGCDRMLIQFNFKNYRSFRDEASLDMSATPITEHSDRIVTIGNEKILPVAAIYGANASGKSNVYDALGFMSRYVINSFGYGDEGKKFDELRPNPFLFDEDSKNKETSFEVYFTIPGDSKEKTYNYGFCIGKEGITEEWLNTKAKTARKYRNIFYREEATQTLELEGIAKASRENIKVALSNQVLIVSLGAKLRINKCKLVRDWFLNIDFADFANPYTSFFMSRMLPDGFVDDENVRKKVVNYFSSFDESVKGFEVNKLPKNDESREDSYQIFALHKMVGSDKLAKIPLPNESSGTLKMFALYPALQDVMNHGGIFVVDELNARLHPLLVRNIILTFLNPKVNINHAQLIFTTHDTTQLSNHLLRRDEIWFTEKDDDGLSTLYSLADFVDEDGIKIRKDENYEKNYLYGKYGATPSLKTISMLEGE